MYNIHNTVAALADAGAEVATMSFREDMFRFYYNLTSNLSIEVILDNTRINANLVHGDFGMFTMPMPTLSDKFGLHDYIKAAIECDFFHKLPKSMKVDYSNWCRAYKDEYSFKAFQEAAKKDIPCSYTLLLRKNIDIDNKVYNTSVLNLCYNDPFNDIGIQFSSYSRKITNVTVAKLVEMDTICDIIKLTSNVPDADIYCRKLLIGNVLNDLV